MLQKITQKTCLGCGQKSESISSTLKLCLNCIRSKFKEFEAEVLKVHARSRQAFNLPPFLPRASDGITCPMCGNACQMAPDQKGFCGLRQNEEGRLRHLAGTQNKGLVSWYYDPLPTNCVASWVCPAGSSCGYPKYSYSRGPEYGYSNLAVFYEACSFDCLFCQNWHFRETKVLTGGSTAAELVQAVTQRVACICYFGGDPGPQLPHAIVASRLALEKAQGRILRICWETNGNLSRPLLNKMLLLSLNSGGCIKFDLKAFNESLNIALCGVSNKATLENFRWLSQFVSQRPDPPLLVASTLLVPGYIDVQEIEQIARFIASLNPDIPYSLLAFYPQFEMSDLPVTSRSLAEACFETAQAAGLRRVHIGNKHLLFS